jgi:UDP-GlcNAc:undecaprenyl-phosphate GlcNAc-1-phosphate transferase
MSSYVTTTSFMFEAVLLASLLVAAFAHISLSLATHLGLVDRPLSEPHKRHAQPTPIAGGMSLVAVLLIAGWLSGAFRSPEVQAMIIASLIIFVFGLWDDFKPLSPLIKLNGQIIAVLILIRMGISVRIFESPEFFLHGSEPMNIYLDWLLTLFWVVGITNAFNFVDSMDGLAVGLGAMAAAFFTLVTLDAGQLVLSRYSALVLGACIGLYFFNSYPAQLFLGDSGAQTLGFILAALGIVYRPLGANQSSSWFVPILLLSVPIFDTVLVVVSRLRRHKPVWVSACDHLYHRMIVFGWNSNRAVLAMQVASLLLGCLAITMLHRQPLLANSIFVGTILIGMMLILYLDSRRRWP